MCVCTCSHAALSVCCAVLTRTIAALLLRPLSPRRTRPDPSRAGGGRGMWVGVPVSGVWSLFFAGLCVGVAPPPSSSTSGAARVLYSSSVTDVNDGRRPLLPVRGRPVGGRGITRVGVSGSSAGPSPSNVGHEARICRPWGESVGSGARRTERVGTTDAGRSIPSAASSVARVSGMFCRNCLRPIGNADGGRASPALPPPLDARIPPCP